MFIRDVFEKNIERNIQSVVKVSKYSEEIFDEIDEYVVTKEIFKCIKLFVNVYKHVFLNKDDKIGFWISGFFGSGKSHFLKILYYILKNIGVDALIKNNNCLLEIREDLKFLSTITRDVILFNIDSKNMKQDNLLHVFVNEFNAMRGFSKTYGFICELEERLSKENIFQKFKDCFFDISNSDWESAREEFYFYRESLIRALSYVKNFDYEDGEEYFLNIEKNYRINVEKFCEKVSRYITSKGENHSVVFMIDEISQFISEDVNKMLNLQTIVEELSNRCFGRAFVVVTSHVDIISMVNNKKYDFSKIQSRFESKLHLSSMNIDEVLCKRLLLKKEAYIPQIGKLYKGREFFIKNSLKFNFISDSEISKMTEDKFISFYPFFPYHLKFIRDIIYFMAENGVVSDDISKGERSVLNFFQGILVTFKDHILGEVVPFYMFYDAISDFVDYNHSYIFSIAINKENLDEFDINVLKILFLVKYLPNVTPSIEIISAFVLSDFDGNENVKYKIVNSLEKLVNEGFVINNGDKFYFLSKVERDVNHKIMEINVDSYEIKQFLCNKIFDDIFKISKVKYKNKINFSLNKIFDDLNYVLLPKNLIGVKILGTSYDEKFDLDSVRIASNIENNVIIYLNNDTVLTNEISFYLKLEKFIRHSNIDLDNSYKEILLIRENEMKSRLERINILVINLIRTASVFVNGENISKNFEDVNDVFINAINKLIFCRFNKFGYINKFIDKPSDIVNIFENKSYLDELVELNSLFINELIDFMNQFEKVSFEFVVEHFKNIPYGFGKNDILFGILYLIKTKRIACEFTFEEILRNSSINKRSINKIEFSKCSSIKLDEFTKYRKTFEQIFDKKYLTNDFSDFFSEYREDIRSFKSKFDNIKTIADENCLYPGKDVIDILGIFIHDSLTYDIDVFIKQIDSTDKLIGYFDEFEMIYNFYNSVQFDIFKEGIQIYEIFKKDKNFICNGGLKQSYLVIENVLKMPVPYSEIPKLKVYTNNFLKLHRKLLDESIKDIENFIDEEILTFIGLEFVCELKNKLRQCTTLFDAYGIKMESIFVKENLKRYE